MDITAATPEPNGLPFTATTGDLAPTSGWWRPDSGTKPFRYLELGEVMARLGGRQVLWT